MSLARIVRFRTAAGAAALVVSAALLAAPAGAADERPVDTLPKEATSVAIRLQDTERRIVSVSRTERAVAGQVDEAQLAVELTKSQLASNSTFLDVARDRLRSRAADAYQRHGASSSAALDVEHISDLNQADQYAGATARIDAADVAELERVNGELEGALEQRTDRWNAVRQRHDDLLAEQQRLLDDDRAARDALNRWGAVPVMGISTLTPEQLAGWFASTGATPRLAAGTTIADVARFYVEEGDAEHVRGDLAFAQAIIETGSFAVAAGNNYSGIGVCDSCTGGYGFPTPRDGVRAQIQLLRNYADPESRAASLAYAPSPALYGANDDKATRLYDTFFLKGKAPLWNLMGGGNWATDPVYAGKVIGLYAQMVAWANAHPTGTG